MHVDGDWTRTSDRSHSAPVKQTSEHRSRGVTYKEAAQWQTHIKNIRRTASRKFLIFKQNLIISN